MLRPTSVGQSALEQCTHLGLITRLFITVRELRVCWYRGLSLTRGQVCRYNCCWSSPVQSFSGLSPVGLVTIFYCLRFETSVFVASYDSQGCGGGIRSHLHAGKWLSSKLVPLITPRHGPRNKHRSSLLYFIRCNGNMFVCKAVIQQRLPYICSFRGRCLATSVVYSHYLATGLHVTI
jgi:hypothetical protein